MLRLYLPPFCGLGVVTVSHVGPFQPSNPGNSHIPVGWSTPWQMLQFEGDISTTPCPCIGDVYGREASDSHRWDQTSSSRICWPLVYMLKRGTSTFPLVLKLRHLSRTELRKTWMLFRISG